MSVDQNSKLNSESSTFVMKNTINDIIDAVIITNNDLNQKMNINGTAYNSNRLGNKLAADFALKTDIPTLMANNLLKSENVVGVTFNYDEDTPLNKEVKVAIDTDFTFAEPPGHFVIPSSIVYIEVENTAKVTLTNVNWGVEIPDVTDKTNYAYVLTMTRIAKKWFVTNVSVIEQ